MAHYMFETEWELTAPIDRVFELIAHPEAYSSWWPSVKESSLLEDGDDNGVGTRASYVVRSPLGYKMIFQVKSIEVDRPYRVQNVVRGDLVGTGTHYLETIAGGTRVRFHWYVSTTKGWMNVVSVLARPGFAFAHRWVMYEGCEAMAKRLGARLRMAKSKVVDVPTPVLVPQG